MARSKEIRFPHDFYGTISELEVALCIDGEDYVTRDINTAIERIKGRLQRQYSIDLSNGVSGLYDSYNIGDEVKNFVDNMYYIYSRLCAHAHFFRYIGEIPLNLSKLNYLGFTKTQLIGILGLLQVEGKHAGINGPMEQIKYKIGTIQRSPEKRLFMLLYVSFMLELHELTAAIAELLYLGGR